MRRGFSLLEILITIGVISILAAIAALGWANYRSSLMVDQAARQAVQAFNEARSNSRAVSTDQTVSWDASSFNGVELPDTVTLEPAEGAVTYTAPYGRTDIEEEALELKFEDARGKTKRVLVYGVTGKVASN